MSNLSKHCSILGDSLPRFFLRRWCSFFRFRFHFLFWSSFGFRWSGFCWSSFRFLCYFSLFGLCFRFCRFSLLRICFRFSSCYLFWSLFWFFTHWFWRCFLWWGSSGLLYLKESILLINIEDFLYLHFDFFLLESFLFNKETQKIIFIDSCHLDLLAQIAL